LKSITDPTFAAGHANANLLGPYPEALERRDDVWVGVSLMAPEITYPDHNHPPEEVYLALSRGYWRQNTHPWHEPGIGGVVYNPPGITHAMRSGPEPFLAIWCLPID
jgi:quercetin dioxygenase-like cupin family protein